MYLYTIKAIQLRVKQTKMKTLKTGKIITCTCIEDARMKADPISNAVIVEKNNTYMVVNYKTYSELKATGYNQVR